MNDTPGWASPGSSPSDGREPGASGPAEPADRPGGPDRPAQPADRPGTEPTGPGTKWSKEQPPPGQWSAPSGPGQAPPPPRPTRDGAPRPRRPGRRTRRLRRPRRRLRRLRPARRLRRRLGRGLGRPAARGQARRHPLRPLGVGEILDGAVSTMRTYWRTVLGISLTVAVLTEIVVVLLQGLVLDDATSEALNDPDATLSELGDAMADTTINSGVVLLVSLIGTVLATALLTTVTSRAVLGRKVTIGEAWRDARPQVARLFGLILLLLLIVAGLVTVGMAPGLIVAVAGGGGAGVALTVLGLLASAVVAVWLMVRFSLASPALMLEKQGIKKAMGRSTKLVRGSWWRVFGIQLLAAVIANVVASIIVIPFAFLAAALSGGGVGGFLEGTGDLGWTFLIVSGIGSVIGSMITFPITAGVTVLLYIDQRIRREALDLELARAAGVQGPAAPGSAPGSR